LLLRSVGNPTAFGFMGHHCLASCEPFEHRCGVTVTSWPYKGRGRGVRCSLYTENVWIDVRLLAQAQRSPRIKDDQVEDEIRKLLLPAIRRVRKQSTI
ncbi:hypothetical protein R0K05_17105, partial [Planococcus sp. SIMBA_160]